MKGTRMYVTAFNSSSVPVTVDAEGRQISPRDWGTVNTTADPVKDAVAAGDLTFVDNIPDDGHPEAVAARDRTTVIADRVAQFGALEKPQLVETATEAGVPDADSLAKPDLVHALASRVEVEVPEPPAEPTSGEQTPAPVEPPAEPTTPVTPETAPGEKPAKQTSRRAGRE